MLLLIRYVYSNVAEVTSSAIALFRFKIYIPARSLH